ncbi:taspase, threonine aspartase, 1 [Entophlyctis luteolus]|nr:taspase, threonine aspartase, 1 [Entophlyctis luteolus]
MSVLDGSSTNSNAALAAVELAVRVLEQSPLTNAGFGSNLTCGGSVETDACVALSTSAATKTNSDVSACLDYSAIAAASGILSPVGAASALLQANFISPTLLPPGANARSRTETLLGRVKPVMLSGTGVAAWLRAHGRSDLVAQEGNENALVSAEALHRWTKIATMVKSASQSVVEKDVNDTEDSNEYSEREDTVGAVAMDCCGNICAAVSSGGIMFKYPGRVGEAAMYGCGVWAQAVAKPEFHSYFGKRNKSSSSVQVGVGCSLSGTGEQIMRTMLARQISEALLKFDSSEGPNESDNTNESNPQDCVGSQGWADEKLRQVLQMEFCESPLLDGYDICARNAGVLAIRVFREANGENGDGVVDTREVLCGHTTEHMGVGWMSAGEEKPTTMIARRLEDGHEEPSKKRRRYAPSIIEQRPSSVSVMGRVLR